MTKLAILGGLTTVMAKTAAANNDTAPAFKKMAINGLQVDGARGYTGVG